jgi:hypothetical protein
MTVAATYIAMGNSIPEWTTEAIGTSANGIHVIVTGLSCVECSPALMSKHMCRAKGPHEVLLIVEYNTAQLNFVVYSRHDE